MNYYLKINLYLGVCWPVVACMQLKLNLYAGTSHIKVS